MQYIKLKVNGMECHGCENRIKNVISNLENVKKVEANFETGIVEVEAENSVSEELIKKKIKDLGFEIK